MPIWANRNAQRDISEFRNLVVEYYSNVTAPHALALREAQENERAARIRPQINMMRTRVAYWVDAVGGSVVGYSEPAMVGGRRYNVDLVANVFNLQRLMLEPSILTDELEKAYGAYQDDAAWSLLRTVNPLYWLGRLLDSIASLPFTLLGRLGFNKEKVEDSIWGRIVKGALYLVQVIAALVAALDKLGWLDRVKHFLHL